jgi:DNA-binding NarL/FixJ family response regulator
MGDPDVMTLRCIIVDDSELFLEGASALLEREGVDVVGVAANSAEALRLVEELQPHVTLVDVDLGGESGFDLAEQLSGHGGAHPNVILISTHAERDLAQLIGASPALGFVPKARFSAKAISDILERAEDS